MNLNCPAILEPDTDGSVLVSFPDVPEAHTFGSDKEEALLRAADALETALEMYVDAGEDIPVASKAKRGQFVVAPSALAIMKLSIYHAMREQGVRKSDLARSLGWHMPQVDRLLDLHHASRIGQIEAAARALGKSLEVSLADVA